MIQTDLKMLNSAAETLISSSLMVGGVLDHSSVLDLDPDLKSVLDSEPTRSQLHVGLQFDPNHEPPPAMPTDMLLTAAVHCG